MASFSVCPYYGCNEDICDVGCGYISSHDASQISRFCSSDYQACPKMIELSARIITEPPRLSVAPVLFKKISPTFITGDAGIAIGLALTGQAVLLYALQKYGLFGADVRFSGSLIALISILQIVVGVVAIKKRPVRGMMFIGSGLLWSSLLAMDLLPAAGIGVSPGKFALSGYFYIWGLFCLFPLQSAVRVSFSFRLFFGLLATYLLLQAAAPSFAVSLQLASLVVGVIAGVVGMGAGLRYALQPVGTIGESIITRAGV